MTNINNHKSRPFLCSWSGGKDSYFAFYKAKHLGFSPVVLLNTLNEFGDRSRSHGIPKELLKQQAQSIGLPIEFIETTWANYEESYIKKLINMRREYSFTHAVFGDIDMVSHRDWEEKVSAAAEIEASLPIWQKDRRQLVEAMIEIGMKCLIVSCQRQYGDEILGKIISEELIDVFENLGVDVCGENGEYHTLVIDGPLQQFALTPHFTGYTTHNNYAFLNFS